MIYCIFTGYTGATCDTNIDDCPANACQNGGTCVDGLDTYTCNCTSSICKWVIAYYIPHSRKINQYDSNLCMI